MKMEQMMACLLAEIRTNRERMEAKLRAEIKTIREEMDTNQEKIETNQEQMKAMLDTCLEKMKANPGELQSVAVHQKVPNEEGMMETIGALEE
jgi:hypothetical protein